MSRQITSTRFGDLTIQDEQILLLPEGLIGIEGQEWVLITREPESPFLWMQSCQVPELALVVTQPEIFYPEYQLQLAEQQLEEIGLNSGDEVEVLCIVKVQGELPDWGINLKGPLVFAAQQRSGAQLINLADYSVASELWAEKGINQISSSYPALPIIRQEREG